MRRFRTTLRPRHRSVLLTAVLGMGSCGGPDPEEMAVHEPASSAPNVVLISIDTLRADHLGSYGYERDTSPHLDQLARDGARFSDCFATSSWTLPSHLSMLTGLAVSVHGIDDERIWNVVGKPGAPERVPLAGTFLPEVLTANGYSTAGFYSWKYLEPRFGFGSGFDTYERVGDTVFTDPALVQRFKQLLDRGEHDAIKRWREAEPQRFEFQRPNDNLLIDRSLEWLDARAQAEADSAAPFFLFVHLFDPHDDYSAPEPYRLRFADPNYAGPIDGSNVGRPGSEVRADMAPADLEHLIALYDGEIAWTDAQVGRLLDGLDERGLDRNTLVVVTSDHGEEFFEHGHKTHRTHVYAESTHVPWILRWRDGIDAGQVIEGPVGLVDIAPTLMGLLDVDAPMTTTGADLSPALRNGAENEARTYSSLVTVFRDGHVPDRQLALRSGQQTAMFSWRRGSPLHLAHFDRSTNPTESGFGEEVDIDSDAAKALFEQLDAVRAAYREQRATQTLRNARGGPLTSLELEELEALGYASGGGDELDVSGFDAERLALDGGLWPDG